MKLKKQSFKHKAEKQLGFATLEDRSVKKFGGSYLKKCNPKKARPLSVKRPMHLVIRSSKATGARSLLNKSRQVFDIVYRQGQLHGVKIYRYANAGNHLHLVILPRSANAFKKFIRAITGIIARLILGVERGLAKSSKIVPAQNDKANKINFWDQRPFTRIVEWGRDFKNICKYLMQNTLEAIGFIEFQTRKSKYSSTA
jgi:REP element-mobilizing transposase RayT